MPSYSLRSAHTESACAAMDSRSVIYLAASNGRAGGAYNIHFPTNDCNLPDSSCSPLAQVAMRAVWQACTGMLFVGIVCAVIMYEKVIARILMPL